VVGRGVGGPLCACVSKHELPWHVGACAVAGPVVTIWGKEGADEGRLVWDIISAFRTVQ